MKFKNQMSQMEAARFRFQSKCAKKFKLTKKQKNKNFFKTDEDDAFLEDRWDEPWVKLFPSEAENGLPKPSQNSSKSRQSILSGVTDNGISTGPPSAKKGMRIIFNRSFFFINLLIKTYGFCF